MTVLVLAEHDNSTLSDQTARAVTAAKQIGDGVHVLVAGQGARPAAEAAAELDGVSRVLLAESEALGSFLAEPVAALVVSLAAGYEAIVAAATVNAKSVLPRAAALLDVMQVSEITAVVTPTTFERPIYAGNAIQTVETTDSKLVVTVRATAFDATEPEGDSAPIETIEAPDHADHTRFVENSLSPADRPELTSARVVVAGGRALGSTENFNALLLPIADKLGAAVGASRAAVDAGYAPNDWQVGQTGKIVAPDLYIACGISGAIQHLAGMKDAGTIVAINNDAEAPIFQIADYGLVADLFEALPELEALL